MKSASEFVQEILRSEEYRTALRERLVNGTAKENELRIAERLGFAKEISEDLATAPTMATKHQRLTPDEIVILERLWMKLIGKDPGRTQPIVDADGTLVGLVFANGGHYPTHSRPDTREAVPAPVNSAEPETEFQDLMPRAWPRA